MGMMEKDRDTGPIIAPIDLPAAIGLLTRLPVPVDGPAASARGAGAAWAYPLAGLVVAGCAGVAGTIAGWIGLPALLVAAIVLVAQVVLTGAMHEDGLADTADGLWGGWDRDRRLEIMKDSRIGAYGVIALILSLIIRWQALTVIIAAGIMWPALIAVAMFSRWAMVFNMWLLPHAREGGLSRAVGRPATGTAQLAGVLSFAGSLGLGVWAMLIGLIAPVAAFIIGQIAKAKIGGQTGDILGATQQLTEIALLLTLVVLL